MESMSNKKLPISLHIFPSLKYIELVKLNDKTFEVEKAASLPCEFDVASRQIGDRDHVMQTIRDLYTGNDIPLSTPAVLTLPSLYTREIDLPEEFGADELRFALTSEAERFYMFKKLEPHVEWFRLDSGKTVYSTLPEVEIQKYIKIFNELKIPLLGIEIGYLSALKGLASTGFLQQELESEELWCLTIISDNSLFFSLNKGSHIQVLSERLISSSEEDIDILLQEIRQDFDTFIEGTVFQKLVVIHNASCVSCDNILQAFSLHTGEVVAIEQNDSTLQSRDSMTAEFPCTLEGLGAVFYDQLADFPRLNFLPRDSQSFATLVSKRTLAIKVLAGFYGLLVVVTLIAWGTLFFIEKQKLAERAALADSIRKISARIGSSDLADVYRDQFVQNVVRNNIKLNNMLVGMGNQIRPGVWLSGVDVTTDFNSVPAIAIEGQALNLELVNPIVQPLNNALEFPDLLEVSHAEQESMDDNETNYFSWRIETRKESAIKPKKKIISESGT